MKKNQTLLELLIGIVGLGVLVWLVHLVMSEKILYNTIGLWSGAGVACFWAIHLNRSLEDSLDLGEAAAKRKAVMGYITRMLVSLLVLGVVIYYDLGNLIDVIIGIFLLKISAYIQPFTHKIFDGVQRRKEKGGCSK